MESLNTNNIATNENRLIKHEGVITNIVNNVVTVSIKGNVNCDGCHAKGVCGVDESQSKEINIYDDSQNTKLNENVTVVLKKNLGLQAVFWAYVFPFVLMLVVLLIASVLVAEWMAGVLALAILFPYYLLLRSFKKIFRDRFRFSILKTSVL